LIGYDTWTSPTTGGAAVYSKPFLPFGPVLWFELADDGTNRKFSYSLTGQNYIQFYSETRTTFITANEIGWFAEDESNLHDAGTWLVSYQEL
jgi:hypothetical protein